MLTMQVNILLNPWRCST